MRRLAAVLVLLAATTGCTATAAEPGSQSPSPGSTASAIRAELAKVKVIPSRPDVPGYKRAQFGKSWVDVDHNHCRTRDDVLGDQLTKVQRRGTCTVIAGTLVDPYTGRTIQFDKAHAAAVQIDHVYALKAAWDMGASAWTSEQRVTFANDRARNLLAVDGKTNESKGDAGPGEWMPLNKSFRCEYVLRYLRVADVYRLPITKDDADAARAVLPSCGGAK